MRGTIAGSMVTCCITAAAFAAEPKAGLPTQSEDAKSQLLALEQQWVVAENKQDAATLRRILKTSSYRASESGSRLPTRRPSSSR